MSLALLSTPFLLSAVFAADYGGYGDGGETTQKATTATTNIASDVVNTRTQANANSNTKTTPATLAALSQQTGSESTIAPVLTSLLLDTSETAAKTGSDGSAHSSTGTATYNQWGFTGSQSIWQGSALDSASGLASASGSSSSSSSSLTSKLSALSGAERILDAPGWKKTTIVWAMVGVTLGLHLGM